MKSLVYWVPLGIGAIVLAGQYFWIPILLILMSNHAISFKGNTTSPSNPLTAPLETGRSGSRVKLATVEGINQSASSNKWADKPYIDYLRSSDWKAKADIVRARDGCICRRCAGPGRTVHHESYRFITREEDNNFLDLKTVCNPCHEEIHKISGKNAGYYPVNILKKEKI